MSKSCKESKTTQLLCVMHSRIASDGRRKTCSVLRIKDFLTQNPGILDVTFLQTKHGFIWSDTWTLKTCVYGQQKTLILCMKSLCIHKKSVCGVAYLVDKFFFEQTVTTEVYLQIFNEFVNQLMGDELTTGYYQQDGATCHSSNASMRKTERVLKTELSQKTFGHPDLPN